MAGLAIKLLPEVLRSLAFGSIGAAYMGIGTAFTRPIRILKITNLTNNTLLFSFNGIDDHEVLPSNGFLLIDVTANKSVSQGFFIGEGTRVYVKQLGVPTTGSVYVSAYYGAEL
jgi:hypothetical protein